MGNENFRYDEFIEETSAIEELMSVDLSGDLTLDKISIILEDIQLCLSSLGYFEKALYSTNKTLGRLQKVLDEEGEIIYTEDGKIAKFTIQNSKELEKFAYYSNKDGGEISREEMNEKIANMIFWSNRLCHTIDSRQIPKSAKDKLESEIPGFSIHNFINKLYEIKDRGIEEMVKSKRQGDKVIFNTRKDEKNADVVDIYIPKYAYPFSVHLESGRDYGIIEEDRIETHYTLSPTISRIPFKLNEEQEECVKWVNSHMSLRRLQREISIVDLCLSYKIMQNRFQEMEKKKKQSEKIDIKGIQEGEDVKHYAAPKNSKKVIDNARGNRQFVEEFNDSIGGTLSSNIMEGLLKRASYSFRSLYDDLLKDKIYDQLDYRGIPDEEKEIEAKKVFIYMRMQKSLSLISAKKIKGEQLEEVLNESVAEYERGWEFLQQSSDKELDYNSIKRQMKENIEETDFIDLSLGIEEKGKTDILGKQIIELIEQSNLYNTDLESLKQQLVEAAEAVDIDRVCQLAQDIKVIQEKIETLEKQIEQLNIEKAISTEKVAEIKKNAIDRVMEI